MRLTASNEEKRSVSCTSRWRRRLMVVGIWFFLALPTAKIEAQTSSPMPAALGTVGVAQPAPTPDAALATQDNSAPVSQPQPQQQPDAQPSASGDDTVFVFKKEVQEVVLHATVVDEQRRLVTNLDRPAFTVFEDGVPQATTSFHRDDVPVAMGIVIDNSGSMREKRDKVNQAVLNLIRASNPNDEIFVVNFSQDSYLDQ